MEGYCVKCNTRRTMVDAQPTTTKTGRPAVSGTCGVCGTRIFRMGRYDPEAVASGSGPRHRIAHLAHHPDAATGAERSSVAIIVGIVCLIIAIVLLNRIRGGRKSAEPEILSRGILDRAVEAARETAREAVEAARGTARETARRIDTSGLWPK